MVCLYVCRDIRPAVLADCLNSAVTEPDQRDPLIRTQLRQNYVSAHHFPRTAQRGVPEVTITLRHSMCE